MNVSILDSLKDLFSSKFNQKIERAKSLQIVLTKLKKKQKKIQKKLSSATSPQEIELYKKQISVLKAQIKKSNALIEAEQNKETK